MEEAIGELHARVGVAFMLILMAMAFVGLLIIRNEEAEDGEEKEAR